MRKAELLGGFVGKFVWWLVSTGFILWGWNVIAPHLNCPLFSFWEMFGIRMGFSCVIDILYHRPIQLPKKDK